MDGRRLISRRISRRDQSICEKADLNLLQGGFVDRLANASILRVSLA